MTKDRSSIQIFFTYSSEGAKATFGSGCFSSPEDNNGVFSFAIFIQVERVELKNTWLRISAASIYAGTVLDPVYTVPDPLGHDIKLNSFKTSVAPKSMVILQNLITTSYSKSGKSKDHLKQSNWQDSMSWLMRIRWCVNGVLVFLENHKPYRRRIHQVSWSRYAFKFNSRGKRREIAHLRRWDRKQQTERTKWWPRHCTWP